MPKSIPELSIDAKALIDALKPLKIGETVTYKALSDIIGRDVQADGYGVMQTAIKTCLRDHIVLAAVPKVGIKRLADTEIVGIGEATLARVRRAARRGIVKLSAVGDFDAMPREAKVAHNTAMSALGIVAHVSDRSRIGKIKEIVTRSADAVIPPAKLLEALK